MRATGVGGIFEKSGIANRRGGILSWKAIGDPVPERTPPMKRASSDVALAVQLKTIWTLGSVGSLTDDELVERFLARTDMAESEAAFAALVERHGAMVLSVCKRIMQHDHDAHDAFQATFLVLAAKAGSIPGARSDCGLAIWYGAARRVQGPRDVARRRRQLENLHAQRLAQGEWCVDDERSRTRA